MTPTPPLTLTPGQRRAAGLRVLQFLLDEILALHGGPIGRVATRQELEEALFKPAPRQGRPFSDVLATFRDHVLRNTLRVDHPRFFAFVPIPGNFIGTLADTLASGLNTFAGTWLAGSGPAAVELLSIEWLREMLGFPAKAGGLFVSGGSMANLTALAAARHIRLGEHRADATVYFSDQTHSSVDRALRVLGFAPARIRRLPTNDRFELEGETLEQAVEQDRDAGLHPFCVVANAGTTNTGAVDPLDPLADLCRDLGLWLHADGAYGAPAVLHPEGRRRLAGIDRADSLTLDPHKWLFQPIEMGCVILREVRHLKEAFHILPEYMKDTVREEEEVNFCDLGIQLTRGFRALKLWMTIEVFGLDAVAEAVSRGFSLARTAEEHIATLSGWEVVTPPSLGILTFRFQPDGASPKDGDRANAEAVKALSRDGFAMLSTTELRGRTVIRLCTNNPRSTTQDLVATLDRLDALARGESPGPPARLPRPEPKTPQTGLIHPELFVDPVRAKNNIHRMAARAEAAGVRLRPHFKTHQSAEVGAWFREAGMDSITVSSLAMAEVFADHGWKDILVAMVSHPGWTPALNAFPRHVRLGVAADTCEQMRVLAADVHRPLDLWIKIDTGYGRTGIPWDRPDDVLSPAGEISSSRHGFAGLLTHGGHSYGSKGPEEVLAVHEETLERMMGLKSLVETRLSLSCPVSVGDTPTASLADRFPGVAEIRPGNFVFYDLWQERLGACGPDDMALSLACPVAGRYPGRGEIVVHGGAVHLSKETMAVENSLIYGLLRDPGTGPFGPIRRDAPVVKLSQEHGVIRAPADVLDRVSAGDTVFIAPVHACLTAQQHAFYRTARGTLLRARI